jgi:NAD-dependent SIR2 family protein deacetylase
MHVIDLHGSLDRVVCMECGQRYDRGALATRLSRENPWLDVAEEATLAPDGDADVSDFAELRVPICDVCSGLVKPDVVFFGEVVPFRVYQSAASIVRKSDVLLVAGSSLAVNSGFRLVDVARRSRIPVVIINRGETKADGLAHLRIDAGVSDVLTDLARRLGVHDIVEDIE